MRVARLNPQQWSHFSETAHKIAFLEDKPAHLDRLDFALLVVNSADIPAGYITCREHDSESLYWQYGGTMPGTKDTVFSLQVMKVLLDYCRTRYKRVTFLVENKNKPMLKMAMKVGFLITGMRNYKGIVLLEHGLEFGG